MEDSFLSQRRQLRCNVHCKGKGEQIEHAKAERQLKRNNCHMMQFTVLRNGKEARTVTQGQLTYLQIVQCRLEDLNGDSTLSLTTTAQMCSLLSTH